MAHTGTAAAKSLQSCPTLCDPIDGSLPGSPPNLTQWWGGLVAKSCPTLATPWTVVCQAPLSMGFSRLDIWKQPTGVGMFPTQRSKPGLPHCRQILYRLS